MLLTQNQINDLFLRSFQQELKLLMDKYGVSEVVDGPHGSGFIIGTSFLKIDDVHNMGNPLYLPIIRL